MHLPSTIGFQSFSMGEHEKTSSMVIVAQKNTFATIRAHEAQKVKPRERGVTNALMI